MATTTTTTTTAPLLILDVRPDRDSAGIAQNTTIEIDFSKPLDTTVEMEDKVVVAQRAYKTYFNQTVASNEIIEGTITFANGDQTVVFTPSSPLFEQADYDVVLDDGIRAASGGILDTIYGWSFQTGIVDEVPDEPSEPQIAPPLKDFPEALAGLSVVSTYPEQFAAQVPINLDPIGSITITFSKDIGAYESNISYEAINGDDTVLPPEYNVAHDNPPPVGDIITLTPTDPFPQNALVTVSLINIEAVDESVMQDYTLSFATVITPAYATVPQIKVLLGPFAENTTDIAIAMLIYEYSLEANILVSSTIGNAALVALAKKKWVQCRVVYDLLFANMLDSQGKSKRLADMEVSYQGVSPREKEVFYDQLRDCINKWEEVLRTGGIGVRPVMTIKGLYDPDRPDVGRNWTQRPSAGPHANQIVPKVVGRRGVKAGRDPRLYFQKNRQVIYRSSRDWD